MDGSQYTVFTHLSAAKADAYRSVLRAFATARENFVIHLRPAEVARAAGCEEETLAPLLDQLVEWGNLDRSSDRFDATTVEDFYKTRWLYQLSARGEAAQRALAIFDDALGQPGELQIVALRDIDDYLEVIRRHLTGERHDPARLYQEFSHLHARFEEFTVQAQQFMQFLQNTIELHGLTAADFVDYKERLIDYLQRFVRELVAATPGIVEKIDALERAEVRRHFEAISRSARADALDPDDPELLGAEITRREGRWNGLRRWFVGAASGGSQAEMLRARAREAIPALLLALQNLHDRRQSGSDRSQDWRELAQWFAEVPDDAQAHRLWRAVFALAPSRHLRINDETLEQREQADESPSTSWLDAIPMWLDPKHRNTGRQQRGGRAPKMVDLSQEREALRRLAEEENAQLARAHAALADRGPLRLSDFEELEPAAFELLLDLLGRAVTLISASQRRDWAVETSSSDGSLSIVLKWPDDDAEAELVTRHGVLRGPNFEVTLQSNRKPA